VPPARGTACDLKRILVRASIAGMEAILAVDSRARFVHCDPLVHVVAPHDQTELHGEAEYFNYHFVHEAWDMIAGIKEPELGGRMRYLDILGVNYYGLNQWEHQRPGSVLALEDPRRRPFANLLERLYSRYMRPILVSETASQGDLRPDWIRDIGDQCLRAIEMGVDLNGICFYPVIDMFEWQSLESPARMGLWDLNRDEDSDSLERIPHESSLREVRRLHTRWSWQNARFRTDASVELNTRVLAAR